MNYFYLKFILTNILFSLTACALILRFRGGNKEHTLWELVLYSLGLGPMVTVTLLYYLLIIVPQHPPAFYQLIVILLFSSAALLGIGGFREMGRQTRRQFNRILQQFKASGIQSRLKDITYWALIATLFLSVFYIYIGTVRHNRLEGHDALIYGNFGKLYLHQRKIEYSNVMLPADNGFMFQGSPKPAFSLLLTWEQLVNTETINKSPYFDTYFRSISGYYGILILLVAFLWLYRKNRWLALIGNLMMFTAFGFFKIMIDLHLDSFRIYFLTLAWIWLAYALKNNQRFSFVMFSLFSGFAAFAHLIGLVAAAICGLVYLLYMEGTFKKRSCRSLLFLLIVILCGGLHYVLEAFYGSVAGFLSYF